ncbi:MAG: hypothetical protein QXG52_08075 [Candidatus Caldarchaeum sp.]
MLRVVAEKLDPGLPPECDKSCPYLKICRKDYAESWLRVDDNSPLTPPLLQDNGSNHNGGWGRNNSHFSTPSCGITNHTGSSGKTLP